MSFAPAIPAMQKELVSIVGSDYLAEAGAELEIDGVRPEMVVFPGTAEEVAEIIRFANAGKLSVVPAGGFTKQHIGNKPVRIDLLLQTSRLNRIEHYDPGDLTMGVQGGMKISEALHVLMANQQMLPLDAGNFHRSTIGGVLATAAHGPRRAGYGSIRDFCIGVQFVTGDGKLAKGGGRVVKNVAGYDLMKLLIGSYGSLAVIVGANFKVFPRPWQTRTFVLKFHELPEALHFRDNLRKTALSPMCLEIVSPQAQEFLREQNQARDPDHFVPSGRLQPSQDWWLCIRASGSDAVIDRYRRELGMAVSEQKSGTEEQSFWHFVSNFAATVRERHRNPLLFSVSVPIQSVRQAMAAGEKAALDYNFIFAVIGRVSVGALVVALIPLSVDPPAAMQYASAASAFRAGLPREGSCIVTSCPSEAKLHFDVWGSTPTDVGLMRKVKRALDPNNVLNPGRFLV